MSHQKKQKAQAPRVSSSRWLSRRKLLLLLALIVLLVIGAWFAVQQVQIRVERDKFMQAKDDLHTLAEQIMTQIGQPVEEKAVQSCSYQSRVYGRGNLFCVVQEDIIVTVVSKNGALALANKIEGVISSSSMVKNYESQASVSIGYSLIGEYDLEDFPGCGVSINGSHILGITTDTYPMNQTVTLSCSDYARAEYFPVQK